MKPHEHLELLRLRAEIEQLEAVVKAAREPLQHIARFAEMWDIKPLIKIDDTFYGIHSGTPWEANLKLSVLRKACKAVELMERL